MLEDVLSLCTSQQPLCCALHGLAKVMSPVLVAAPPLRIRLDRVNLQSIPRRQILVLSVLSLAIFDEEFTIVIHEARSCFDVARSASAYQ